MAEALHVLKTSEDLDRAEEALETLQDTDAIEYIDYNTLYDRQNPLEYYSDREFQENFAFRKEGFLHLLGLFGASLTCTDRDSGRDIPALYKLSTFLQYLRSNGFLRNVASQCFVQMSEPTVCRVVNSVAIKIANFSSKFIKFPDLDEQKEIAERYISLLFQFIV